MTKKVRVNPEILGFELLALAASKIGMETESAKFFGVKLLGVGKWIKLDVCCLPTLHVCHGY